MAYSTNPNLPKAREIALKLLIKDGLSVATVARKCGVHRSTIWRWKKKWLELNQNVQLDNPNRPGRPVSIKNKLASCSWRIATESSRPNSNPCSIPDFLADIVMAVRDELKRCSEVVWHHLNTKLGITLSLSSVRRVLRRHHYFYGARQPRLKRDNPRRPRVTRPGELIQTDTIHYICPYTAKRKYVYIVIDLYTRMTYARVFPRILPGLAARTILEAREYFGFAFLMVQADNGPEFGRYFSQELAREGVAVRHSCLGRPNDNAHIERFNRTIQEECTTNILTYRDTATDANRNVAKLLNPLRLFFNLTNRCRFYDKLKTAEAFRANDSSGGFRRYTFYLPLDLSGRTCTKYRIMQVLLNLIWSE